MIDFSLSEEQQMLKTSAREFLQKECPETLVRKLQRDEKGYSPELWKKIAELGWLGIPFPEKYGGMGGNAMDMAVIQEEIGRALFPSPYLSTVVLCGNLILNLGSEEQKDEFLPKIVNGKMILSLAITEPESSWDDKAYDPEGITVKAAPDKNDYIINGTKLFVHDAHIADYILCVTRTQDKGAPENGITLFLVDAKSPGVSYTVLDTLNNKNQQCEVIFKNVRVPKKNMVGKINEGWAPLFKTIQLGAVMLSAQMVGAGERVLEITVDYAKTRIQFEMPIGVNQFVQEHCVQIAAKQDACRRLTEYAAWSLGIPEEVDFGVAACKAWVSEAHEMINWHAHQVLAGVGSMAVLHILPLYTRSGLVAQYYLGSTPYWLEKVTIEMEKLPPHLKTKGKPLGLWDPGKKRLPVWDIWREYAETL
jgi:alkylation response protein AidB-like acyl-CoA dehydrogenase